MRLEWDEFTEADEGATSTERALENLAYQVQAGESMGIISMYEMAALNAGCTHAQVECAQLAKSA
jgi:hypothetical protein